VKVIRTWIVISIVVLAAMIQVSAKQAYGIPVSVTVNQDSVSLNLDLVLKENLSALPAIDSHISLANSTSIIDPFLSAMTKTIQSRVPTAQVSGFDLNIKTTSIGSTWTIEETYTVTITGANTNSGSNIRANLAFVSLNISQPLMLGSADLNGIGPTYLLPALQAKAANYSNLQYFIDGSQTRNAVIPEATTQRFWLLDFTWVTPISTWTKVSTALDQSSRWTLTPANPRYNLTLGIPSPEGTLLSSFVSIYNPSFSLTAPAYARVVDGTTLSFDAPAAADNIAPILILALIVLLVATLILNRRITGPLRRIRKR
jgi:hypothetical protein